MSSRVPCRYDTLTNSLFRPLLKRSGAHFMPSGSFAPCLLLAGPLAQTSRYLGQPR
jgi:hypothetical protein